MLIKQHFIDVGDEKGTIIVRNTYDCSRAIEMAKTVNSNGGPQMGRRSDDCEVMGFIPEEEWLYDIFLIAARSAQKQGDMGQYTKYMKKYFKNKSAFATPHQRVYWQGSSAVLL